MVTVKQLKEYANKKYIDSENHYILVGEIIGNLPSYNIDILDQLSVEGYDIEESGTKEKKIRVFEISVYPSIDFINIISKGYRRHILWKINIKNLI